MLTLLLETIRDWVKSLLVTFHSMYLGYVTPQLYGAKGDGVHDDTQAIQSAVDSAKMGDVIYFPHGKYNISETILIDKSLSFIGDTIRVGSTDWGTPNCDSIIQYSGEESNVTLFEASPAFRNISFKGLSFVGNSFKVKNNPNRPDTFPRPMYTDEVIIEGINAVDLYPNANSAVSFDNCLFYGFSGFAVKIGQHQYVNDCSFSHCYDAIQSTMDCVISNCWFSRCHNAIKTVLSKEQKDGDKDKYYTSIASDIWADQLSGHFFTTEEETGIATCFFDNINIDLVDEAVIHARGGLGDGHIAGKISRFGMACEGISESDLTEELRPKSCGIYTKLTNRVTIEMVVYPIGDDRKLIESPQGEGLNYSPMTIRCESLSLSQIFGKKCHFQQATKGYHIYTKDGLCTYYHDFWYTDGKTEYVWGAKGNILAPEVGVYCYRPSNGKWQISTKADDKTAWVDVEETPIDFTNWEVNA